MAVTGSNPAVHVRFFAVGFWCFGAQVAARAKRRVARGRNGGSCEFGGVGRGSLVFSPIFFDACFAVYNVRRLLGSKTWISATSHWQGPRIASEARNSFFGITGARNRPIPTPLPIETCTQTPLDRPKLLFRRDPDFANTPETAQDGGFRHHFATACVFADF